MISVKGVTRVAAVVAAVVLLAARVAMADTHAPWPTDWNNWNDPALWVPVGNPGNTGELSGVGQGVARICGGVGYTFNMGKFEVTAGQYAAFLNAVAKTDIYGLYNTYMDAAVGFYGCGIKRTGSSGNYTYSVPSDWENRPVNFVSWGDVARFANWLTNGQPTGVLSGIPLQDAGLTEGGSYALNGAMTVEALMAITRIADASRAQGKKYYFIPTEDEWYKAAYHKNDGVTGNYWDFPTGTYSVPSNVLSNPDPGNSANYHVGNGPVIGADDNSGYTIGSPYFRTEVGEFENSESPYGTFDQGGNVWEWNETVLYNDTRCIRGGGFFDNYDGSASIRGSGFPTHEYFREGFRVSEVPEPATLLLLGGLMALRRRR